MQDELSIQALILKHLNDPDDVIIAQRVEELRALSVENEQYFQTTKNIWEASAETNRLNDINLKRSVGVFRARLNDSIVEETRRSFAWERAAAAILILAVGFWIYGKKTTVNYLVKNTGTSIDSVFLSDGTKVVLAANSSVRYPEHFSGDKRPISLVKGKAFFLVTKDPKHPFEVSIGKSKVKVLGTSFNIHYSERKIDLDVKTGRVMFTPNAKSKPSILYAGDGISYDYVANTLSVKGDGNATAWFTKELRFVDMPLDEVCKQLSEYYGVKIILHDKKLTVKKFNANFKDTSLEDALLALKETYPIKIKKDGLMIIIKSL